jgi:transposase-like protein
MNLWCEPFSYDKYGLTGNDIDDAPKADIELPQKQYVRYSQEDKESALELCKEMGFTKVSKELGIPKETLSRWVMGLMRNGADIAEEVAVDIPVEETPAVITTEEAPVNVKKPKPKYSQECKGNALELCEGVGFAKASKDLGIPRETLYRWRAKLKRDTVELVEEVPVDIPIVTEEVSNEDVQLAEPISTEIKNAPDGNEANDSKLKEYLRLLAENIMLKEQLAALKLALRAYTE